MTRILRIDGELRRCFLLGRRVHHFWIGIALAGLGVGITVSTGPAFGLPAVACGLGLVWHDRGDYPWAFTRG